MSKPGGGDRKAGASDKRVSIRHRSMAEQTADLLRDMILKGRLLPGQSIRQDEMANELGVSTMPVREALLRLTHQGFITAHPNRSFVVTETTREDIRDVYWLHAMIAGELTARSCRNSDREMVKQLEGYLKNWRDASHQSDLDKLNFEFHRLINRRAGSPKLLKLLQDTLSHIPEEFYVLVPEWRKVSEKGHAEIVKAFKKQDPDLARQAAERHVADAGELLIKHFSNHGYWVFPEETA